MPLFMDIHKKVDGATAEAVAEAHERDLGIQAKYGVPLSVNIGLTKKAGRSSAWSKPLIRKQPGRFTVKRTAWWPMRFTRYQKIHKYNENGWTRVHPFSLFVSQFKKQP